MELEFLDQSRERGRGERSGRLWLYGRPAIKKREQQVGWLAGWLAGWLLELPEPGLEQQRAASGCSGTVGGSGRKGLAGDARGGRVGVWGQESRSRSSREASQRPLNHGRLFNFQGFPDSRVPSPEIDAKRSRGPTVTQAWETEISNLLRAKNGYARDEPSCFRGH